MQNLVWALFLAVSVAIIYLYFMQRALSGLANRITENGCQDTESAKSLKELGYKNSLIMAAVSFFAENGTVVARAIKKSACEEKQSELLFEKKQPVKYYMPPEERNQRFEKHINDKLSAAKVIIILALVAAIALASSAVIDFLSEYAGNVLGKNENTVVGTKKEYESLLEQQEQLNKQKEEETKKQEALERLEELSKEQAEQARKEHEANKNNSLTVTQ